MYAFILCVHKRSVTLFYLKKDSCRLLTLILFLRFKHYAYVLFQNKHARTDLHRYIYDIKFWVSSFCRAPEIVILNFEQLKYMQRLETLGKLFWQKNVYFNYAFQVIIMILLKSLLKRKKTFFTLKLHHIYQIRFNILILLQNSISSSFLQWYLFDSFVCLFVCFVNFGF